MDYKRSKGVTFWAWFFIVTSVYAILSSMRHIGKPSLHEWMLGIVMTVAYVVCGVMLLQLKESARKAVIILGIISIFLCLFDFSKAISKYSSSNIQPGAYDSYYAKEEKRIVEQVKPEYQQAQLEKLREKKDFGKKAIPIFWRTLVGVLVGSAIMIDLASIYFFTRPKVKEQFTSVGGANGA